MNSTQSLVSNLITLLYATNKTGKAHTSWKKLTGTIENLEVSKMLNKFNHHFLFRIFQPNPMQFMT